MSMTAWQETRSASIVEPTFARIEFPAFEKTGIVWPGASSAVRQYNYSASKKFILLNRPVQKSSDNYVPCIKYRVGPLVYRYKLWSDNKLIADIPLYNGEIIRKHFCIEIWNLENEGNAINVTARQVITNRHVDRLLIRDYTTLYALATAALANIEITLPATFPLAFDSTAWLDNPDDDSDIDVDLVTLSTADQVVGLEFFYLRDPSTGLYYKVTLTDVDGYKDFQIGQDPIAL